MNWATRLLRATHQGKFPRSAIRAAAHWGFCAVGEQFGEELHNVPSLYALNELGRQFYHHVRLQHTKKAQEVFLKILAMKEVKPK